uniref:Uncharacterized protein n=1 Tax=Scleropages formosus TaxID=113540 RepID=A0A8C9R3L6_SCLFO
MEKERGFNFKLLVPPRISTGQVSAVKPQEVTVMSTSKSVKTGKLNKLINELKCKFSESSSLENKDVVYNKYDFF